MRRGAVHVAGSPQLHHFQLLNQKHIQSRKPSLDSIQAFLQKTNWLHASHAVHFKKHLLSSENRVAFIYCKPREHLQKVKGLDC